MPFFEKFLEQVEMPDFPFRMLINEPEWLLQNLGRSCSRSIYVLLLRIDTVRREGRLFTSLLEKIRITSKYAQSAYALCEEISSPKPSTG